ncbi:MAG: hypothetical protein HOK60_05290 [Planctomycetes bacterium]|jgi:hypothetical protein|nr:hypothetical protein [Planctomycetota bacterium]MBT7105209.1 hypothetical protein [Planctomycetota bacterium]
MNLEPPRPASPARILTLVAAGWLLTRGAVWIFEAIFSGPSELHPPLRLTDIVLGSFCILLSLQLLFRAPGARFPAIIVLFLHAALLIHRFAILDASSWWKLSQTDRLQVIFETGISSLLAIGLCIAAFLARSERISHRMNLES